MVFTALTHIMAFALGVLTWRAFTLWEGHKIQETLGVHPVTEHPKTRHKARRTQLIVLAVVASLFVMGLGIQQSAYQRCYEAWGEDVIDTLDTRVSANDALAEAQTRRDESVDQVLLVALAASTARPPMDPAVQRAQFAIALEEFGDARTELLAVLAKTDRTKKNNPYPALDCGW